MLKRAYLSITRRKSKSILLFIILFVVANLIITTIAIKNATNESTEFAKRSIGSEVTLSVDMQRLRQNLRGEETESSKDKKTIEIPKISVTDVLSIADSEYISSYSYGFTAYANVKDLQTVESEMEKMGDMSIPAEFEGTGEISSSIRGQKGENFDIKFDMKDIRKNLISGDITLLATNSFENLSEVKSGTMEIIYGDHTALNTDNAVIVSYDFAELNELMVGSVIELIHTESEEIIELEVAGIYENSKANSDNMSNMIMNSSNTMYINFATGEKFMTEEEYNEGAYGISSAVYYLNDPNNYEFFVSEAEEKVDLEASNLKLSIDESTYERMVGSIESIGSFANIILTVVIIASILLVTLIINSQIKERNYEMGVLLSLGEKKRNIVGQIALELIIIATIAFVISTLTGSLISGLIGENLSVSQSNLRQEQQMLGRGGMQNIHLKEQETEKIQIDVSVGFIECLVLFGLGYIIVLLAMILPAVNIFRYDPKTILTRRE